MNRRASARGPFRAEWGFAGADPHSVPASPPEEPVDRIQVVLDADPLAGVWGARVLSSPPAEMSDDPTHKLIAHLVQHNPVVLFMKGNPTFPQCGFSAAVSDTLKKHGVAFHHVNVLREPAVRDGIKSYSDWPTIPQLYVGGEFIGGCDIVRELDRNGELAEILAKAR